MLTYYFRYPEDAPKRAKANSKHPGCYFSGITRPSGKRGFAVYKDGKIVTQYGVMNGKCFLHSSKNVATAKPLPFI